MRVPEWRAIESDPDYQALSEEEKMKSKYAWFQDAQKEQGRFFDEFKGTPKDDPAFYREQWNYFNTQFAPTPYQAEVNRGRQETQQLGGAAQVARGLQSYGEGIMDLPEAMIPQGTGPQPGTGFFETLTRNPEETQALQNRAAYREGVQQTRGGSWGHGMGAGLVETVFPLGPQAPGFGNFLKRILLESSKGAASEMLPYGGDKFTQGVVGAAGGAAGELIGSSVTKGVNATRGLNFPPEGQEVIDLGKKHNVPVGFVDTPVANPIERGIVQSTEPIPILGSRGWRLGQQEANEVAGRGFIESLNPPSVNVITDAALVKDAALMQSVKRAYKSARGVVKTAYEEIPKIAKANGVDMDAEVIPLTETATKLKELLDEYPNVFDDLNVGKSTRNYLEGLRAEVTGEKFTWNEVTEGFDKKINELIGLAKSKERTSGGQLDILRRLYEIKKTVNSDLDSWVATAGNRWALAGGNKGVAARDAVTTAWRDAKKAYIDNIVPFEDERVVRSIMMDKFDPDFAVTSWIKQNRPGLAQRAMGVHDLEGQQVLQAETVFQIFRNSHERGTFMPGKFADQVEKMGSVLDELFANDPLKKRELEGLAKLYRATEASGASAQRPGMSKPSAWALIGGTTLGGISLSYATHHPFAVGGALLTTIAASKLFTSVPGRNILLAASRTEPKRMGGVLRRAEKFLVGEVTDAITNSIEESSYRGKYGE